MSKYRIRLPRFEGPDVTVADVKRLTTQIGGVYETMYGGEWRTLAEIEEITGYPQSSISAQLRHLRKPRWGEHQIDGRRRHGGTWEYRMRPSPCGLLSGVEEPDHRVKCPTCNGSGKVLP